MFFASFVKVYDSEGTPSLGLMPASSPLHLTDSSPFPLPSNTACTTALAATVDISAIVSFMYS